MCNPSHMSGYNYKAPNCGKCGVLFSEEHPRCSPKARWAVCRDCYNEHNRLRRRKGRPPKATHCRGCGSKFTEDNPRCAPKIALCRPCQNAKARRWRHSNVELARKRRRDYRARRIIEARKLVWNAYGRVCACCGEVRDRFLTLEHRLGGGSKHRRKRNTLGVLLDIIKAGFPLDYCLYCMNCNFATANGELCPHELERRAAQIAAD